MYSSNSKERTKVNSASECNIECLGMQGIEIYIPEETMIDFIYW